MSPFAANADSIPLFDYSEGDPRFATYPWTGTFDAQSRLFTIVGELDVFFIPYEVWADDVSGSMFLSAFIDLDGSVESGALSVIGKIPSLGITTESLLMAGEVTAVSIFNFGISRSDPMTQALIELEFALPELGFGHYAGFQALTDIWPGPENPDEYDDFLASIFDESFDFQAAGTWGDLKAITVPEPGNLALFGIGLLGMGLARRRKA
jgi:hypothetical protein